MCVDEFLWCIQQPGGERQQFTGGQAAVTFIHSLSQCIRDAGANTDHRGLLNSEPDSDCVGSLEADPSDVPGEPVRVLGHDLTGIGAIESVWFGDAAAGNYDLCVGAIVSSLLDPSDYFNAWYRTDGPQNHSFWHNAEFDKLLDQIDSEVDPGKRQALIRRAEDIMEQDPPLVPVAWENILDAWYNYVKGHNPKDYFGIYDVVRFDTFWLDKA